MLIIQAFEDEELDAQAAYEVMVELLYVEVPDNRQAAADKAFEFMQGGPGNGDGSEGNVSEMRCYSIHQDARFIFAAFRQTHGIDLSTAEMHFWTWLSLFMGLGEETFFCKLVALRSRLAKNKGNKEDREWADSLGSVYTIKQPDTSTPEEKELKAEFNRLVALGEQKKLTRKVKAPA